MAKKRRKSTHPMGEGQNKGELNKSHDVSVDTCGYL